MRFFKTLGVFASIYIVIQFCFSSPLFAQGCVAVRSGCGNTLGGGALQPKGSWQVSTNFRYFHSFRHFRGTHEEKERVENGTEVINDSFFSDWIISYGITNRLSIELTTPFVYHKRSSMYEHGGNPREDDPTTPEDEFWAGSRRMTQAAGLADLRLTAYYWLLDPAAAAHSNISFGIGLKLPTGNYRYNDEFFNQGSNRDQTIIGGVDQSIQPGDGGFGVTLTVQAYRMVGEQLFLNTALFYLVNPDSNYELSNRRGGTSAYSIPDQYAGRLGLLYLTGWKGLNGYLGIRAEGIPSSDLIGDDEGFRRPGYVVSIEPGLNYSIRNFSMNLTVPVAIERNRIQSYTDKVATRETGQFRHGDAAFADYLVNVGVSYRFGGSQSILDWSNPATLDFSN